MGTVVRFPSHPVPGHADVLVRITDEKYPKDTRMRVQLAISKAAGFGALKDFTDYRVRMRLPHRFTISSRRRLSRFISDIEPLARDGLVRVKINGARLEVRKAA